MVAGGFPACGSRAELAVQGEPGSAAALGGASGGSESGPALCALIAGPVASCAGVPATDTVQVCGADFPYCVQPVGTGTWACCNAAGGPYNGSHASCQFAATIPVSACAESVRGDE